MRTLTAHGARTRKLAASTSSRRKAYADGRAHRKPCACAADFGLESEYRPAMRTASGKVQVFTFKDGVLSAVAHDLRLHFEKFRITLDGQDVRAEFDLKSLSVDGPMENGALREGGYDAGKRAEVEKAMHHDVLKSDRNPQATFVGKAEPRGDGFHVNGTLALAGGQAPLAFDVKNQGGRYAAAFEIKPSQWGIAQYKALLGAIRLKDVVRIELDLTEG